MSSQKEAAEFFRSRVRAVNTRREGVERKKRDAEARVEAQANFHRLATSAKIYLEKAVDLVYRSQVGDLEEKINQALAFVFHDRDFRIRLEIDDSRGSKTVDFVLEDHTDPEAVLQTDIKDGQGAGVRTVVSILVHVYYLLAKRLAPILFIDEGYAFIAEEYEENFFEFIKTLARQKDFALVIISHDKRFAYVADAEYRIDRGMLKRVA